MATATILIGNSDDKLAQREWADYVNGLHALIRNLRVKVHFQGLSVGSAPWQNACWVIDIPPRRALLIFKDELRTIATRYRQDSIAIVVGETEFVEPKEDSTSV